VVPKQGLERPQLISVMLQRRHAKWQDG
jgi:hypothetical protein